MEYIDHMWISVSEFWTANVHILLHAEFSAVDYILNVVCKCHFFFIFKYLQALNTSWKLSWGPGKSWIFLSVKEWEACGNSWSCRSLLTRGAIEWLASLWNCFIRQSFCCRTREEASNNHCHRMLQVKSENVHLTVRTMYSFHAKRTLKPLSLSLTWHQFWFVFLVNILVSWTEAADRTEMVHSVMKWRP